ncbi:glycosyl transferase, partial [Streptomyces vinaceus]
SQDMLPAQRVNMEAGARRLPQPPVARRYDIARSAERLLDVYALALPGSRPVQAPPRGAPVDDAPPTGFPARGPETTPIPPGRHVHG